MQILSNRDNVVVASFDKSEVDTFHYFYSAVSQSKVNVELSVIDLDKSALVGVTNLKFSDLNKEKYIKIVPLSSGDSSGYLEIYTENILKDYSYIVGNYQVSYKFYFDELGNNSDQRLFIRKISPSRKEIIVDYATKDILSDYNNFSKKYFNKFSRKFTFNKFIDFSTLHLPLILNAKNQKTDSENSLILKLYEPLPARYAVKDTFWIIELLTDVIEDVVYIDFSEKIDIFKTANILRPPSFTNVDYINRDYTTYKNYYSLVDTSSLGDKHFSELLTENYMSGIDLDIKYRYFENFIHFGSALQIIDNFRTKLLTIEQYETKITSSLSVSNDQASSSAYYYDKKYEIVGQFTPYEKFLYFESGSYFTSSLYGTSSIDATYPKYGDSMSAYIPYEVSSSYGENWYATMSAVAFEYDYNNNTALISTLPAYIRQDLIDNQDNQDYITFVNMMGEFFDNIWIYIVSTQRTLKRENKFEDGVPSELIWNVLRNYGLNLNNGENLIDLTRYNYGYNVSASVVTDLERKEKIVTHEIWNRILNNYPYIFKSKGTEKSIRALFNCYGLPNSLIQIKEFGGPYTTSSFGGSDKYTFDYTDFTFVLEMTGSEYIEVPWTTSSYDSMHPDSIEFKFRAPTTADDMDLFSLSGSSGEVKLELQQTYSPYGRLKLSINDNTSSLFVTSSLKAFYNNEFYSVLVNRSVSSDATSTLQNYFLNIKNHDDYINTITIDESNVISIAAPSYSMNDAYTNASSFYLGGSPTSTQKFVGAFDEFRLWAEVLTDRTFDFHTKYSVATNGNTLTSSLNTLAFRLSFNDAYNLGAALSMSNDAYNTASYAPTASAVGFASVPNYPYNFADYERSNTVEQSFIAADMDNRKIRIERNRIVEYVDSGSVRLYPLKGNYTISDYKPQGEVGDFDNAPPDLDTLLIGFTPVDFVNKDIIAFYGNNDILTVYGDFNNLYEDYYPPNTQLITTYWDNTKNPISFQSYLEYIATYNKSLFDTVMELVPAKASLIMGTVYEQNMLRRNRVKLMNPEEAANYRQHIFPVDGRPNNLIETLADNDSYEAGAIQMSRQLTFDKNELDDLTGHIQAIITFPSEGFDLYEFGEIVYRLNEYNLVAYNDGAVNRQRYNTDKYRNFAGNTKNSSLTSYDRGPVVVITSSNPKKLIVNYADNPKLLVK